MRINLINNNFISRKYNFKANNKNEKQTYTSTPDVNVSSETYYMIHDSFIKAQPQYSDLITSAIEARSAKDCSDKNALIRAKAENIILSLQLMQAQPGENIPSKYKNNLPRFFTQDPLAAQITIDLIVNLDYKSTKTLEDMKAHLENKEYLNEAEKELLEQLEIKIEELKEEQEELRAYLKSEKIDEIKECLDAILDKRNYLYLRALKLGENAAPFDVAKTLSETTTLLHSRQLVFENETFSTYYYPKNQDPNNKTGLYLIVLKNTGEIHSMLYIKNSNETIEADFELNGQLHGIKRTNKNDSSVITFLPDYQNKKIKTISETKDNVSVCDYQINPDWTLTKLDYLT